ncbi:MAG TPA: response regulator transcription factor, partial [Nitrososphaera sp.]|nr:response regulator transcription factor [Nitrososphaera sp.]
EFPWLRMVVLSDGSGRDLVLDIFRAGAKGFFDRAGYDPVLLCRCLQCVADGQIWAKSEQLEFVFDAFASAPRIHVTKGVQALTRREREVALLVSEGLSNAEVAHHLGLSVHTVKNYLFSIFDKIGVSSRAELILYLLSSGAQSKDVVTETTSPRDADLDARRGPGSSRPSACLLSSGD